MPAFADPGRARLTDTVDIPNGAENTVHRRRGKPRPTEISATAAPGRAGLARSGR